jgi:hypothetical protein
MNNAIFQGIAVLPSDVNEPLKKSLAIFWNHDVRNGEIAVVEKTLRCVSGDFFDGASDEKLAAEDIEAASIHRTGNASHQISVPLLALGQRRKRTISLSQRFLELPGMTTHSPSQDMKPPYSNREENGENAPEKKTLRAFPSALKNTEPGIVNPIVAPGGS